MKQVIAMHGWSGDSRVWRPWQRRFQHHGWTWQNGERGYGSRPPFMPTWSSDRSPIKQQRRVIIGHSLGPHLLPEPVLRASTDVVLLACFSRFVPVGRAGRALHTGLIGMGHCIGTDQERTMLHTFLNRAAAPESASGLPANPVHDGLSTAGRQRLRADLTQLRDTASLPSGLPTGARVLVVNAGADAIVVAEARRQLLEDLQHHLQHKPSIWTLEGSGHALLVPDLLLRVQEWLEHSGTAP
ncbi:MAG: alpha/beta hydrolase [Synechococcus sp. NAT40]|jgi:pimeloyl-[acyl-carrier protein] methyl ester esterase|nr:alpha/beta hydrolase [Synechococcus sp. NAT40]RZO15028.1 MAG: alpha/beta hydrolase [Synechococcus sp. MED-G135]